MRFTFYFFFLLLPISIFSQENSNPIIPDTPPSPQAVAFNRLGDFEANNNYGIPDISIPLYEIDFLGYKIPLLLRYEASPMKPGYNYDVTGLGWTLSGNSCVSRTIKDRADEWARNSFSKQFVIENPSDYKNQKDYPSVFNYVNFQYDSYNIVLPTGRSIPFYMYKDEKGVMHYSLMSLDQKIKISCHYSTNSIDSFQVIDENGVTYDFTLADKGNIEYDTSVNAERNVTWLLTCVDIPTKGKILYDYTDIEKFVMHNSDMSEPEIDFTRYSSSVIGSASQEKASNTSYDANIEYHIGIHFDKKRIFSRYYKMRLLKKITFGPSCVMFNYRDDNRHMKDIIICDCNDTIRTISLNKNIPFSKTSTFPSLLEAITISGNDVQDSLVYHFVYSGFPTLGNYTDYWGNLCDAYTDLGIADFNMYFDRNLLPARKVTYEELDKLFSANSQAGFKLLENQESSGYFKVKLQSSTSALSIRRPSSPNTHAVLCSIIYPNGGKTTFNYENNRFLTASYDGDIIFDRRKQTIAEGGGFRIESIKNWTADGNLASADYYRYGFTYEDIVENNFPLPVPEKEFLTKEKLHQHIGCGEPVVDPNILTFMDFKYYAHASNYFNCDQFRKMAVGLPSAFNDFNDPQGYPIWWEATFSANTFRSLLGGRKPVVYPEITVYHGNPDDLSECKGKTVYKYDIYSYQHSPYSYYLSSFNQTALPDTAYFEPICYRYSNLPGLTAEEMPQKRDQLKSKLSYSYNTNAKEWNITSEEKYKYDMDFISKSGYTYNSPTSFSNRASYVYTNKWLQDTELNSFYQYSSQKMGKSELCEKSTTVYRQGSTSFDTNTIMEKYDYLYSGVIKKKESYENNHMNVEMYSYVGEENDSDPIIAEMKKRNMLASTINSTIYSSPYSSDVVESNCAFASSSNKIEYTLQGDTILPYKLYDFNSKAYEYSYDFSGNGINEGDYEPSLEVKSYDTYGNPTEIVDLKTDMHSVILWDTYGRYMTAMIKNATLSQVESVSSQLTGTSQSRHATLQTLLPNAMIQTWDYKPMIGVTSVTDINGRTTLFEYDGLGRLKKEKRVVNGKTAPEIIHEYEYNYKN